jgi:hypothetical protein
MGVGAMVDGRSKKSVEALLFFVSKHVVPLVYLIERNEGQCL